MRFFEIVLIGLTLAVLFFPNRRIPAIGQFAVSILILLVFLIHLVVEQSRWQMVPIYLVAFGWIALVVVIGNFTSFEFPLGVGVFGRIMASLATFIGITLALLFPIIKGYPVTGDYAVGTTTFYIEDTGRIDSYADVPNTTRQLNLQLWYPAEPSDAPIADYVPNLAIGGKSLGRALGFPGFILSHLRLINPASRVNAPIARAEAPYPLVLFSHGWSGIRIQNTQQAEELASQGYVVAAVDHPYAAAFTVYPGDRVVAWKPSIVAWDTPDETVSAQQLVTAFASDMSFVVDVLESFQASESHPFADVINFEQIGAFGHSTGGGASYEFCYRDARCKAAMGLDPWLVPVSDEVVQTGLGKPIMVMKQPSVAISAASEARLDIFWNNQRGTGHHLEFADTKHFDFTDFKRFSPVLKWLGMTGGIDAKVMNNTLNDYSLAFFDHHLRGWAGAILYAESAEYPDVTLKTK